MSALRTLLLAALLLIFAPRAHAQEQIGFFDVTIQVRTDGDILVTENIDVRAEHDQINRGIFRDLPRYYETNGERLPYEYEIVSVQRDGNREPYETEDEGNAHRIRIGDADVMLDRGMHHYVISYLVKNQVRYFADYDEIYWNVTGNYWAFPIKRARAVIELPPGGHVTQQHGYTGRQGANGTAYSYTADGDRHIFETTQPLNIEEGLTVAIGFEKGLIEPPSNADAASLWWHRYGALGILLASLAGLFFFLYSQWRRVGRDPLKGPVFPRYEAPDNHSPAAIHYIYYRGAYGHRALIATFMNLAVKKQINIDATDKKVTILTRTNEANFAGITNEDAILEKSLFGGERVKRLGGIYDSAFTSAYGSFRERLMKQYGNTYFRWNLGYVFLTSILSVFLIAVAASQVVNWTIWHTAGVLALAALNVAFMYFMPAPTQLGQDARTAIEGFKLYLETAEKLQLNSVYFVLYSSRRF